MERVLGRMSWALLAIPLGLAVTSAWAVSARVSRIMGCAWSSSRSRAEEAMTGSGMGKLRALTVSAMLKMTL